MPTVTATVGDASANSYVTRAEADSYFDGYPSASVTAWTSASDDDKDRFLITATRNLENLRYWGEKAASTQALSFPRNLQPNTAIIPPEVINAQLAEALEVAKNPAGAASVNEALAKGITAETIGSTSRTFGAAGAGGGQLSFVSAGARILLTNWIKATGKILGPRSDLRYGSWPANQLPAEALD